MTKYYNSNDNGEQFWIQNIRNGDERAFEILFKKYYQLLTRFAWRYVKSNAVAEEIVQEVFTELWAGKENWYVSGSLRPFLYKAVKNNCLNYLKHQKIKHQYDAEWVDETIYPEKPVYDECREQEIRTAIRDAVEELPIRSKMTYKLHRHDGLTYSEIAEVMDVSVKTVESQMSRTLKILRKRLSYLLPFLLSALMKI